MESSSAPARATITIGAAKANSNAATPRARITGQAAIALSQHGTVAPSSIHHRTEFAASMIDGRTVMELPRTKRSTAEIKTLWTYLESRLERIPDFMVLPTGHSSAEIERRFLTQGGAAE